VSALETELKATWNEWRLGFMPGTMIVAEPNATVEARTAIETARRLQCRVIASVDGSRIVFYAQRVQV
jgi:hypothetical protein